MFSKAEFKELFKNYKLVQLYTDVVPEYFYASEVRQSLAKTPDRVENDAATNLEFVSNKFNTTQLPLYVILEPLPDGKIRIRGKYTEGKINSEDEFARFLKEPVDNKLGAAQASLSPGR